MLFYGCPNCYQPTPVEDDDLTDRDQVIVNMILVVESLDELLDGQALSVWETDYALALLELFRPQIVLADLDDGECDDDVGMGGAPCQT